ncbi:TPA: hypothetical protein KNH13_001883 [Clostridioides difficile]|uniref:hypothetical protein n=1 Tax=Clostridioides difficile TaxID=1496 RepID=UPI0012FFA338|nr:hypothetical protein [Clostridioides difficile]MEC5403322.1 hypothetical protein [Clostridioides difficile]HBE9333762.1 hypothetical protein [Clostridioides difficile]
MELVRLYEVGLVAGVATVFFSILIIELNIFIIKIDYCIRIYFHYEYNVEK